MQRKIFDTFLTPFFVYFYVFLCIFMYLLKIKKTLVNTGFISIFKGFSDGGESEIRTLEPCYRLHDFQSCALDQLGEFSIYYTFAVLKRTVMYGYTFFNRVPSHLRRILHLLYICYIKENRDVRLHVFQSCSLAPQANSPFTILMRTVNVSRLFSIA